MLNVLRYETRRPGNVEFFRSYVDDGQPGHDIAVSVLLDYSGSMWNVTKELAQVAFASKAACDRLGIPCTVVLWDTEARVLWDANEKAEVLPTIDAVGGTNPAMALNDLDNQQYGKAKHIVLVMTDDDWSGNSPTLTAYRAEDRVIVGLGYGGDKGIAESMARKGANFAYSIEDLAEIPKHLEQALVSVDLIARYQVLRSPHSPVRVIAGSEGFGVPVVGGQVGEQVLPQSAHQQSSDQNDYQREDHQEEQGNRRSP